MSKFASSTQTLSGTAVPVKQQEAEVELGHVRMIRGRIAIGIAAFIAALASLSASAGEKESSAQWKLRPNEYSCVILFEDAANLSMFQYALTSGGDHSVGFRPPNWEPDSGRDKQQDDRIIVTFGEYAAYPWLDNDFMLTRDLKDKRPLLPEDFKLFQDYQNFAVRLGGYEMIVPTEGIQAVRDEFAQCLNGLANAGIPPAIKAPRPWKRELELTQPALIRPDVQEIVIEVDRAGKPSDCRTIPNASSDQMMKNICTFYLSEVQYSPARDGSGEAISGDYVLLRKD